MPALFLSPPDQGKVERETANARVGIWLRYGANARVQATTGEVPLMRLEYERERLQPIPALWPGALQPARPRRPAPRPRDAGDRIAGRPADYPRRRQWL